jgi:hypothetical protein
MKSKNIGQFFEEQKRKIAHLIEDIKLVIPENFELIDDLYKTSNNN